MNACSISTSMYIMAMAYKKHSISPIVLWQSHFINMETISFPEQVNHFHNIEAIKHCSFIQLASSSFVFGYCLFSRQYVWNRCRNWTILLNKCSSSRGYHRWWFVDNIVILCDNVWLDWPTHLIRHSSCSWKLRVVRLFEYIDNSVSLVFRLDWSTMIIEQENIFNMITCHIRASTQWWTLTIDDTCS
jgi:hypothetical protein